MPEDRLPEDRMPEQTTDPFARIAGYYDGLIRSTATIPGLATTAGLNPRKSSFEFSAR